MGFFETKYGDDLYVVFRIGIGALFLMLGVQKLFGLWGMPGGAAAFDAPRGQLPNGGGSAPVCLYSQEL